ncbi:MAG: diguanylate cyclase [Pseudomonadota bacterium]
MMRMLPIKTNLLLALGYAGLAGLIALFFQLPAPLWPSAGLAAFAALAGGWRWMPGIALGSWVANDLLLGWSTPGALWVTLGNVLGPMVGVFLLRRIPPVSQQPFARTRGVVGFFTLVGALNGLIAGLFGAIGVTLFEKPAVADFGGILLQWAISDGSNAVLLAPALYLWWKNPHLKKPEHGWGEALTATVLLLGLTALTFFQPPEALIIEYGATALILLPLTWLALRCSQRDAYTLLAFVFLIMLGATLSGYGPFAKPGIELPLTNLQIRISMLAAVIMLASALDGERRSAIRALAELNAELEARVQERAKRIEASHARLRRIVETLPSPMVLTFLSNSAIIEANPAAAATFGYRTDELAGRAFLPFYADPDERKDLVRELQAEGTVRSREMPFVHRDGHKLWLLISAALIQDGEHPLVLLSFQDITSAKAREHELAHHATTDALTGMTNRRHFLECAEHLLHESPSSQAPAALLILDLDLFKAVNDLHGHLAGDKVLRQVAFSIQANLRQQDLCGRLGGEEFGVLLPNTDEHGATELAERLREAVERLVIPLDGGARLRPTISIGGALTGGTKATPLIELLAHADHALYAAKDAGRNRVVFWSPPIPLPVAASC